MNRGSQDLAKLLSKWGIELDPEMVVLALTHRSFAHEQDGLPTNERLEFLGDAVLQLIVTERLYRSYPSHPEGHLAKMRSATVSQEPLASVARNIGLGDYILLGRGEEKTGGREKDSILSDTVEALIGATYLCHGLEATREVVENLLKDLLDHALERGAGMDWKTTLQELTGQLGVHSVEFAVTGTGPDHNRRYSARAVLGDREIGFGKGRSKKVAEHEAARQAVMNLRDEHGITTPLGF